MRCTNGESSPSVKVSALLGIVLLFLWSVGGVYHSDWAQGTATQLSVSSLYCIAILKQVLSSTLPFAWRFMSLRQHVLDLVQGLGLEIVRDTGSCGYGPIGPESWPRVAVAQIASINAFQNLSIICGLCVEVCFRSAPAASLQKQAAGVATAVLFLSKFCHKM